MGRWVRTVEGCVAPRLAGTQRGKSVLLAMHRRLLAAGFSWDGADGYAAPEGWAAEDSGRLWQESMEECGLGGGPDG